jgi:pyruvate kinase
MNNYEIIATLGPASNAPTLWQALLSVGASAFRLNTSHLTLEELHGWLDRLEGFLASLETRPPLVLDLQGSKWRLGQFAPFVLDEGQHVELVHAASSQQANVLPVPHADFFKAAALSNGQVVLNDARILLQLEPGRVGMVRARVTRGGEIAPNKGITFAACDYRSEALSEKDLAILEQTRSFPGIRYAISYIKDAAEMAAYRARINELSGQPAYLIAKLERRAAVEQARQMTPAADELWLCRGDLGAELGLIDMAGAVQRFSAEASSLPVPAILAGQVLEHMTGQPTPTRSEVCYLHDALGKGYRGIVLSDETAIGRYPVESCRIAALFRTAKLG